MNHSSARRRGPGRLVGLGILGVLGLILAATASAAAGETVAPEAAPPQARWYLGGSGRFEVVAAPGEEGLELGLVAERAWPVWQTALGLPDRLPVAITVRLAPADAWGFGEAAWRVAAEPTGVVTLWIRGGRPPGVERERVWLCALAEAALRRLAYWHGAGAEGVAPAWLAAAAAEDAFASAQPAMLDAWRQFVAARAGRMPALRELLLAPSGSGAEPDEAGQAGAYGIWLWLRAEAGRGPAWRNLVKASVSGVPAGLALVKAYPGLFPKPVAEELELAWQTAAAGLAGMRGSPGMEAAESRRWLMETNRLLVRAAGGEGDEALRPAEVWSDRNDPVLFDARETRIARLNSIFGAIHPFYRNAAGSLGRVFLAQREGDQRAWLRALGEWREDMASGEELERASAALLDELGKTSAPGSS